MTDFIFILVQDSSLYVSSPGPDGGEDRHQRTGSRPRNWARTARITKKSGVAVARRLTDVVNAGRDPPPGSTSCRCRTAKAPGCAVLDDPNPESRRAFDMTLCARGKPQRAPL